MIRIARFLTSVLVTCALATGASAQKTVDLNWQLFLTNNDATIAPGDTVRWTWTDSASHDVFSANGGFTSSSVVKGLGTTYSVTFPTVGSYPYYCSVHGQGNMNGTITVVAPPVPALSAPVAASLALLLAGAGAFVLRRRPRAAAGSA